MEILISHFPAVRYNQWDFLISRLCTEPWAIQVLLCTTSLFHTFPLTQAWLFQIYIELRLMPCRHPEVGLLSVLSPQKGCHGYKEISQLDLKCKEREHAWQKLLKAVVSQSLILDQHNCGVFSNNLIQVRHEYKTAFLTNYPVWSFSGYNRTGESWSGRKPLGI